MGERLLCPGCNAESSSVLMAASQDEPCPYCGLSSATIFEVNRIKAKRADQSLKDQLAKAIVEIDRWQHRAAHAEQILDEILWAMPTKQPDPRDSRRPHARSDKGLWVRLTDD